VSRQSGRPGSPSPRARPPADPPLPGRGPAKDLRGPRPEFVIAEGQEICAAVEQVRERNEGMPHLAIDPRGMGRLEGGLRGAQDADPRRHRRPPVGHVLDGTHPKYGRDGVIGNAKRPTCGNGNLPTLLTREGAEMLLRPAGKTETIGSAVTP